MNELGEEHGRAGDTWSDSDRADVASQIHDGPIQSITAASLRLQSALHFGELSPDDTRWAVAELEKAAADLRALIERLLGSAPRQATARDAQPPVVAASGATGGDRAVKRTDSATILVVDDHEVVRNLARRILEGGGYAVLEATSGPEALRICQERDETIDLLLTDMSMPGMSGPELADGIRILWPGIRVLWMSGYAEESPGEAGQSPSRSDVLQKPFTPAALTRRVEVLLAGRSP